LNSDSVIQQSQELGEAPADAELREEYQEMTSMVLKELLK
jgi:hypothetical protein